MGATKKLNIFGLKGLKGDPGPNGKAFTYEDFTPEQIAALRGVDGKTAYQYAVEAGYSGTEEEFAEKLVKDIPEISEGGAGYTDVVVDSVTLDERFVDTDANGDILDAFRGTYLTECYNAGVTVAIYTDGVRYLATVTNNGGHIYANYVVEGTPAWVEEQDGRVLVHGLQPNRTYEIRFARDTEQVTNHKIDKKYIPDIEYSELSGIPGGYFADHEVLFDEGVLFNINFGDGVYGSFLYQSFEFIEGNEYAVVFDGAEYLIVFSRGVGPYGLGDYDLVEYPFWISGVYGVPCRVGSNGTHYFTMSVTGPIPISERYIPGTIARTSDIPTPITEYSELSGIPGGYEVITRTAVIPKTTITVAEPDIYGRYIYNGTELSALNFVLGDEYLVEFNGVDYDLTVGGPAWSAYYLGNGNYMQTPTETLTPPFCFWQYADERNNVTLHADSITEGNLTFAVYSKTRTPVLIDEKYIPVTPNADLAQSDPDAKDYVKNRTHYEANKKTNLYIKDVATTYTGNFDTFGGFLSTGNGQGFVRLFTEYVNHQSCIVCINDTETTLTRGVDGDAQWFGNRSLADGDITTNTGEDFCIRDWTSIDGTAFLYARNLPENQQVTVAVFVEEHELVQLDEKYIPDTIARVSDIPEPGVSSWNDLEDRPFGEEMVWGEPIYQNDAIITTDDVEYLGGDHPGINLGLETEGWLHLPDSEEYLVTCNGVEYICKAENSDPSDPDSLYSDVYLGNKHLVNSDWANTGEPFLYCHQYQMIGMVNAILFSEPGTYSVTISPAVQKINTIDPKYLPEGGVGSCEITWLLEETVVNCDTLHNGIGGYTYLDKTVTLSEPIELDQTYIVSFDGVEHAITATTGYDTGGNLVPMLGTYFIMDGYRGDYGFGIFDAYVAASDQGEHTISVRKETIIRIDPKFIPDVIARTEDIPDQVQSDWNQADSTSPDYVKNRTHWVSVEQRSFYSANVGQSNSSRIATITDLSLYDYLGKTLTVMSMNDIVGRSGIIVQEENYIRCAVYDAYGRLMAESGFTSGPTTIHTLIANELEVRVNISGDKEIYHPLNEEFIPDSVKLPTSTSSDSGKFLRVGADGVPVWQTISNAEEASF